MAHLAIGGVLAPRPQAAGNPAPEQVVIDILPRMAEQIKPAVTFGWNHARTVMKQEGIALTLLFFCTLNLLPVWIAATLAVCGIARLVWALSRAQTKIAEAEEAAQELARLQVENEDLKLERNQALRNRDAAEDARDETANAKAALEIENNLIKGQLADAQGALAAVNQRREMERRVHQLQLQEQGANENLHEIAARDRDLLEQERNVLREGVDRRDEEITQLERERNQSVLALQRVQQEKQELQQALAEAQVVRAPDEFQLRWQQIEQRRNEALLRICEAYQQAVQNRNEDSLSGLEMQVGQIIPELVAQKQEAAGFLDEALVHLPGDHEARPRLIKLKGLYDMEKESLENVARVFALPVFIRRMMFQPAQLAVEV